MYPQMKMRSIELLKISQLGVVVGRSVVRGSLAHQFAADHAKISVPSGRAGSGCEGSQSRFGKRAGRGRRKQ